MPVYAILAEGELLPNYFSTYKNALNEVKRKYPYWDDRYDEDTGRLKTYPTMNKVEVEEGHKMNGKRGDPNLTELYIEREISISIHRLVKKDRRASVGGGYSRKLRSKINTNNSRKHRV